MLHRKGSSCSAIPCVSGCFKRGNRPSWRRSLSWCLSGSPCKALTHLALRAASCCSSRATDIPLRNQVIKLIEDVHGGTVSALSLKGHPLILQQRRIRFPAPWRVQPGAIHIPFHPAWGRGDRKSQTSLIPVTHLDFHSLLLDMFVIICIPSDQWVNSSIHNK